MGYPPSPPPPGGILGTKYLDGVGWRVDAPVNYSNDAGYS
jgi:hypothetical protein